MVTARSEKENHENCHRQLSRDYGPDQQESVVGVNILDSDDDVKYEPTTDEDSNGARRQEDLSGQMKEGRL